MPKSVLESEVRLPADRAFVVQFAAGLAAGENLLQGRAEHLVSGQVIHFESLQRLTEFVIDILRAVGAGE